MQTVLIVIHLMVVSAMIGVVLLQRSEGGGLGMGGGGGGFLTSRGTANVLTRTTAILAVMFFAISLLLSIIAGFDRKPRSILEGAGTPATQPAPGAPAEPLAPGGGGVLDTLRQQGQPPAGQAPAQPQVPQSQ
ncbi:MAG TPA: preprotein translocase subunit SecG [Xanthobacteraceae bacterium]|jgi:preprotein translocase subunit SecG|nr:preprotein translocase subunit SecG [Xanthobacteraceae bacterium]